MDGSKRKEKNRGEEPCALKNLISLLGRPTQARGRGGRCNYSPSTLTVPCNFLYVFFSLFFFFFSCSAPRPEGGKQEAEGPLGWCERKDHSGAALVKTTRRPPHPPTVFLLTAVLYAPGYGAAAPFKQQIFFICTARVLEREAAW